jgi:hypothetical protein
MEMIGTKLKPLCGYWLGPNSKLTLPLASAWYCSSHLNTYVDGILICFKSSSFHDIPVLTFQAMNLNDIEKFNRKKRMGLKSGSEMPRGKVIQPVQCIYAFHMITQLKCNTKSS